MTRVDLSRKIQSRRQLKETIENKRRAGLRVVFTNGCFDLLHVGHVRYLEAAARKGDVVVVAVNADDTVRELKGPGRPVLPLGERLKIIASLAAVDYVVAFEEPTPHALLRELRPDVLVKGGDYDIDGVVGREVVWEYGGEVCVVNRTEDVSTTATLERIRAGGNEKAAES